MNKLTKLLTLSAVPLILSACASSGIALHGECVYPNSPRHNAPGWVCDEPVENTYRQAYGYSRNLAGGHGMMRNVAETEARAELSRQFISEVSSELKRHATDNFSSGQEGLEATATDNVELLMENFSSMELTGVRIIRTQSEPGGGLFVLVGISEKDYAENLQRISQSMPSEADIYRRFLMEEARNRLNGLGE